jgi:hypothetical protein
MGNVDLIISRFVVALARQVDELKNERPPRYYAASTGKEISSNDVFEDRGLSRRLRSYHYLFANVSVAAAWHS